MSTITYYLDMQHPEQIRAKPLPADLSVVECRLKQFQLNRFLYQLVGEPWQWTDKLSWTDAQWRELIEQPHHRTWVAYHQGAIAGYYELLRDADGAVEILYFGLAGHHQGLGAHLQPRSSQRAGQLPGAWPAHLP